VVPGVLDIDGNAADAPEPAAEPAAAESAAAESAAAPEPGSA